MSISQIVSKSVTVTLKFNNYFYYFLICYLLDFLSRIPTIPELKRYQAEIVIKEEPEEVVEESDADIDE